ncbi:MAG TPA: NAD(P)H-hydrate dehydratase [Rubricoccaceae bacterium]|nr:NAD(P)H-hydrate dehydratase [Rubricoccaceae bacterium]
MPDLEPILTAAAMREADRRTIAGGTPGVELMEAAGRAAAAAIEEAFFPIAAREVWVLPGKGNNGGDGFVVARLLHAAGARVRVITLASENDAAPDAAANLRHLEDAADDRLAVERFEDLTQLSGAPDLVIDALLGTGAAGALRPPIRDLCAWMNAAEAPVVALDVPTGLDSDTGQADRDAVHAALTVTFGALKAGLVLGQGPVLTGRVVVADLGIPQRTLAEALQEHGGAWRATDAWVAAHLPRRAPDAHKYSAGRVLAVVGSRAFTGAAVLATGAAYRAGAGAVVCATPKSAQQAIDAHRVEVMVDAQPETDEGTLSLMAYDALMDRTKNADAVLVGCGLGRAKETQHLVQALLRRLDRPAVLDADGLHAVVGKLEDLGARTEGRLVLTPHLGEFRRLIGDEQLEAPDRIGLVREWAARWNSVLVLKGMPSVVGAPDGRVFVGPPGHPALATAGTGDVLAGTIAGLLAQGLAPAEAAVCALHVGTAAVERFAKTRAPQSLVASDLLEEMPFVLRERFAA